MTNIALTYYDKAYNYNHEKRNMKDVFFIESDTADAAMNAEKILNFAKNVMTRPASGRSNLSPIPE